MFALSTVEHIYLYVAHSLAQNVHIHVHYKVRDERRLYSVNAKYEYL